MPARTQTDSDRLGLACAVLEQRGWLVRPNLAVLYDAPPAGGPRSVAWLAKSAAKALDAEGRWLVQPLSVHWEGTDSDKRELMAVFVHCGLQVRTTTGSGHILRLVPGR